MPEHVYTVVARGHSVDAQTNNVTLFQILERIGVPGLPVRIPEFTVATSWRREPGDEGVSFTERVRLADPQGGEVAGYESSFTFERTRHRVIVTLVGLAFEKSGVHRVEVYLRKSDDQSCGEPVASYPFDVVAEARPSEDALLPTEASDAT